MSPTDSYCDPHAFYFLTEERESEGFEVENGNMLNSSTGHYLILDFIGEGRFGKVAKSVNLITAQDVALKIFKTEENMDMKREVNH